MRVTGPVSSREALTIYLKDQHAIAEGVLSLARRAASNQRTTEAGPALRQLANDLNDDQRVLVGVMEQVGARPSWMKTVGAQLGERAGRFKLNGQLRGSSPLSPVIELEGLLDGITAGRHVWVLLRDDAGITLDGIDPDEMVAQKDGQLDRVRALWHDAARRAFSNGAT